jgi:hypothetical protein
LSKVHPVAAAWDSKKSLLRYVTVQESDTPLTLVTSWTAELKK